jgi:hypothetical protein
MYSMPRGRWLAASALAGGLLVGAVVLPAAPVAAEPTRYIAMYPAAGDFGDPLNVHVPTGAYCPPEADRAIIRMTGPGLESPFNLIGNSRLTAFDSMSIPGTTIIPLLWTWYDAQGYVEPAPIRFDGTYRVTLHCLRGLSLDSIGQAIADVEIDQEAMTYRVVSPQPAEPPVVDEPGVGPGGSAADPPRDAADGAVADPADAPAGPGADQSTDGSSQGVPMSDTAGSSDAGSTGDTRPGAAQPAPPTPEDAAGAAGGGSEDVPTAQAAAVRESGLDSRALLLVGGAVLLTAAVFTASRNRRSRTQP